MSQVPKREDDRPTDSAPAAAPAPTLEYPADPAGHEAEAVERTSSAGTGDAPTVPAAGDVQAASRAGYEILGELGRGGMGVVYKARQIGLNRWVALKMILAGGHAGPQELARFRAEAEALARIQQPNIVQIYEVGEVDGRPFFSLEFVGGGSLADKLDGTPWPARSAAQLVETLARAVHAAHEQGIVHRDLKPANVLLQEGEKRKGKGEESAGASDLFALRVSPFASPKITDFGLAKRLDATAAQTQSGTILGTPSYMAPEQAGGKGREIGPATDVYALGAILYELLTGRPPFKAPTPLDTVLQVVNDEPVPPSRLLPKLPRDLETICLKCLQKDPGKRYGSAVILADELRRFLAGEPILARPAPLSERLAKWARRRPATAALLGVSATALLALLAIGVVYQGRLQRSNVQLQDQRDAAERARIDLEKEHERAQAHLHNALQAVDRLLKSVGSERFAKIPELQDLRRQTLEEALAFYDGFLRQEGDDPAVRRQIALANFFAGDIYLVMGKVKDAEDHCREAMNIQEKLVGDFPDRPEYRNDLAKSHVFLSFLYAMTGRFLPTMTALDKAKILGEELTTQYPDNADFQHSLAQTYTALGTAHIWTMPTKAEAYFRQVIRLAERLAGDRSESAEHARLLAGGHGYLGMVLFSMNRLDEAEKELRRGLELLQPADRAPPRGAAEYRQALAFIQVFLGAVQLRKNRAEEAAALLPQGIALFEELLRDSPTNLLRRMPLAMSYPFLGDLYFLKQEWSLAEQTYRRGVQQLDELSQEFPAFRFFLEIANPRRVLAMVLALRRGEIPMDLGTAQTLAESKSLSGELSYNLACVFALASNAVSPDRHLAEDYCRRAIGLLRRSETAGYLRSIDNIEHARNDDDLKALRQREDFRALMSELEQKAGRSKSPQADP
jgi:serine/threonine protein kinase